VIERFKAWMERCKSLVKNLEQPLEHAVAKVKLYFIRLMLKRLGARIKSHEQLLGCTGLALPNPSTKIVPYLIHNP
jgi:hypothetical protein